MRSSPLLHVTLELDHALRALLVVTDADPPLTAAELASATDVPSHFLSRVVQKLRRAGLLRRGEGFRGLALARPADEITVAEVVAAIQGQWAGAPDGPGGPAGTDRLGPWWRDVERGLEAHLSETTIADLHARSLAHATA